MRKYKLLLVKEDLLEVEVEASSYSKAVLTASLMAEKEAKFTHGATYVEDIEKKHKKKQVAGWTTGTFTTQEV